MAQRTGLEIIGQPGKIAGIFVTPIRGRITLRVIDDHLRAQTKLAWGLETQEILIKCDRIESIQVTEGRIWWLLWLGIATFWFLGIGFAFIIAFFLIKQRWLIVYSGRQTVILFFKENQMSQIRTFAQSLMAKPQRMPPTPPPKRQESPPKHQDSPPRLQKTRQS
ncbi:hypothetical protein VB712_17845 [Spirulina sp. CCNP1310]|uniref:hypothetical protein n=1 Tax=Spirulina sp. CCNP1310 TaxID=3110249 RepID=UPI002B2208B7|nr:hypothetical protein [Spirulina sp. CCNP1310]MEA5421092.1 hypothetical protein [Spirulina sp. CCNP1310]